MRRVLQLLAIALACAAAPSLLAGEKEKSAGPDTNAAIAPDASATASSGGGTTAPAKPRSRSFFGRAVEEMTRSLEEQRAGEAADGRTPTTTQSPSVAGKPTPTAPPAPAKNRDDEGDPVAVHSDSDDPGQ